MSIALLKNALELAIDLSKALKKIKKDKPSGRIL